MEIFENIRGGVRIGFRGYQYTIRRTCSDFHVWKCIRYVKYKCMGLLRTSLENTDPSEVKEHNHPPSYEEVEMAKTYCAMKKLAANPSAKASDIVAQAFSSLAPDAQKLMPSKETLKRTLRKRKARVNRPLSSFELDIGDPIATTDSKEICSAIVRAMGASEEQEFLSPDEDAGASGSGESNSSGAGIEQPSIGELIHPSPTAKEIERPCAQQERESRNSKKLTEMDDCGVFAEMLARQLRKLSQKNQAVAKYEISTILFKLEMNELDSSSSPTVTTSYSLSALNT